MRIASFLLLSGILAATHPAAAQNATVLVPTPRATLVSISATNRPFLAADHALQPVNLAAAGFVEEEYTVSGLAGTYVWDATAQQGVRTVAQGVPYTTRLLLRRPKEAAKFSGRVIVELLAADGRHDAAALWGLSHGHFMAQGDAWVGLTVAPTAVASLQRFDPVRYAALTLPSCPSNACPAAAGDPAAHSGLVWDVIAQTGALLRSSSKENPLLHFDARQIIAAGAASAGSALVTYVNALHGLMRLGGGAPVYDGYLELAGAAGAQALDPCATTPAEQDPRRAVMRREVPFVAVMAQTQSGAPQAGPTDDSEEAGGEYRLYQIAGTSSLVLSGAGRPAMADLAIAGVDAQGQLPCTDAFGTTMWSLALEAIWWQLRERIAAGTPMNREPRIGKDAADHVIGGWRLPQVDLPLADESQSSSACSPAESGRRYDAVRLKQLYGSRGEYLRRFQAAVDAAVQARRLTSESGAALKASIASSVPAF